MKYSRFPVFLFFISVTFVSPAVTYSSSGGDHKEKGSMLFKKFCAPCHGEKGKGDGPNADDMDPPPRDLTDSGKEKYMIKRTNEEIFKAISAGGREIEKSGLMPAFGKTFSEEELWSLVAFVRTLYKPTTPGVDFGKSMNKERPKITVKVITPKKPDRKVKMRGKRAFGKYGCSGCHKIKNRGGVSGPDLSHIASKLKPEELYKVTQNARSVKPDSSMPVYNINEKTALTLARYLMLMK